MIRLSVIIVMLTACRLPHVEPALRDDSTQRLTLAAITSTCMTPDPFDEIDAQANNRPPSSVNQIEWVPPHGATAFVISERHALTAAHAVFCPAIPVVTITTVRGRRDAVVERDDRMFPHQSEETDLARLELSAANGFGLNIAPPFIRDAQGGESCCAETLHGRTCGTIDPYHANHAFGLTIRPGDSGSPLYCDGALVGLITQSDGTFAAMSPYWLEGT